MAAVTTGVEAIGSFPSLDEFTAPAHQEQECVERVQQHTVEQIVHVPQIHEQIVEGVKEFPQERLPQQTVEQIENATPVPVIEFVAPAPVVEYIAPALPVTISWASQLLPPPYTMDSSGLVNPRCSTTAVGILLHRSLGHFLQ